LHCSCLGRPCQITLGILVTSIRLIRLAHLISRPRRTVAGRAVVGIARRAIRDVLTRLARTGAKTEHKDEQEWKSHGYLAAPYDAALSWVWAFGSKLNTRAELPST